MSRVQWDVTGQRLYHLGVDRGMFYIDDIGVPWVGLASVTENPSGGDAQPYFLDGQKILNIPSGVDFDATIESYGVPPEFAQCAGRLLMGAGLYAADQPKLTFGFSYRTKVGNDLEGNDFAYKIHVVYNALAKVPDFAHETTNDTATIKSYSWSVTTVPVSASGVRPTAHVVVDSRLVTSEILAEIEDMLYGDVGDDPRLPALSELAPLLAS